MKNKNIKEYNQISKKELIENDKILIINKFGFIPIFQKTNSAINKKNNAINSNITLSSFKTQKNKNNKNLLKSHSNLILTKNTEGRNYSQYKPSLTNASTNTNLYSSFYNSKKKLNINNKSSNNINKEQNLINSCLWHKLIKNIDKNQNNKINYLKNKNINSNNTHNDINGSSETKSIQTNNNISKNMIKHFISIKKANPIKLKEIKSYNSKEYKSSNDEKSNENKNNDFNNNNILDEFSDSEKEKNNIVIRSKNYLCENKNININLNNSNINNIINHKGEKFLCKFVNRNNIYDISSRSIKEEKSLIKFFYKEKEKDYLFISEIEKKNKNISQLNLKKFIDLSDKCIYNILSFQPEMYLELINSNKYVNKRINLCLEKIYKASIEDFKLKYKNILQIIKYDFIQKKINAYSRGNNYILDLILYCKIITKETKQSVELSCNFFSKKEKYDYVWIFDIQKKSGIKRWISSEINSSRNFQKNLAISYTSQVSPFSYGDEIQIQINIFNMKNIMDPGSLEWCKPIINYVEPGFYEKTKYINNIIYDPIRACEIEMQILFWSSFPNEKQNLIIKEVTKIFEKFFEIKNIWTNSCKYDFYKIVMKPIKTGLISKNRFFSFDINIIDEDTPIQNEIQCIYFLNTNSFYKKMDIRLGNDFIFYILDMKVI